MSKLSIALLVSAITSWFYPDADLERNKVEVTHAIEAYSDSLDAIPPTVLEGDTNKVKKTPNNRQGDATRQGYVTPLFLGNPSNLQTTFNLRDDLSGYDILEQAGKVDVRRPSQISFEDFIEYRRKKGVQDYFREQSMSANKESQQGLALNIDIEELSDIFGGGTISIRPTGYATLDFSIDQNKTNNSALSQRQQQATIFNFDQQIQLGVIGQIGEKLRLNANFDTQATFDFENELKLEHSGTEDQILQKIEAGNVSMQLGNSLIQGRQNLFGLKTRLRFGPVYVTAIASTERGKVETVNVSGGGAIETPFEKEVSQYDMNRHFFLSHYFRSRYEDALSNLPVIRSTLRINRVEVWVEQQGATRNTRNAIGFIDLGENNVPIANGVGVVYNDNLTVSGSATNRYPDNASNNLFNLITGNASIREQSSAKSAIESLGLGLANTEDFQVLGNMRRLEPNEYTINNQLGYISLNSPIPTDQVLFVAFNYSIDGQAHQVGEFSDDVPANGLNSNVLFTKMLKSSVLRVNTGNRPYPAWDLMMKNIYNIGYGLQSDGFFLDIRYESGTSAGKINFLPGGAVANVPLIQVTGVDRVTNNTAPNPDNYFDFIEGITIRADRGLVIFPVLEPFGSWLADRLENNPDDVNTYVFQPLYDDTQQGTVQNHPELNRYTLEGYYRSSSSSEIPLNTFNLAEGSVTVTAGGRTLTEGVDYQVDYFGGKVNIINQSILTSGQDIAVSYESSSLYQVQTKTLLGSRIEYSPTDEIQLGGTILNLREQPFNQKTTLGDEPINNTLWGLDAVVQKDWDLITKLVDRIPLISTKEASSINAAAEFAQFIPGQPGIVKNRRDKGIVFIDDFEAAATPFSLQGRQRWKLASFPEGNPELYVPGNDSLELNYSRAKMSWYQIDQVFYQRFGIEFPVEDLSNNYTRQIQPWEIFPTASRAFGNNIQPTFDMRYMPDTRGPYNYQTDPNEIDPMTGKFVNPTQNWAGIMREIDVNNDFEATNVEFVEFWMMDPFMDNPNHTGGDFYVNLGLVNEDILPDEALSQERGLPGVGQPSNLQETPWGRVPIGNTTATGFSNTAGDRELQDIGMDGLSSADESPYFEQSFLSKLRGYLSPAAMAELEADPSTDDFLHFRDDEFEAREAGILERYENFNGTEKNSPEGQDNRRYTVQASNLPDTEDLNGNGSLNYAEQYWQYKIELRPDRMIPGQNFIVDKIDTTVSANNRRVDVTWYQFRIPLSAGTPINNIANFKTISFMRMYMAGFSEEIITRMTEFQLVATQWRRFAGDLHEDLTVTNPPEPPFSTFELGSVSLEENSTKLPFNYSLPPGVERQALNGNTQPGFLQDERSLTLRACDLEDGDARAIFKNVKNDLRLYDRIRMWVHAESIEDGAMPSNFYDRGDARVFIRFGLDNDLNYYEYEIPLTPSMPGIPNDKSNTWPTANEFDFPLALFALAKADRNAQGTGLIYRHEFTNDELDSLDHRIYIKGTPKLSDVRNIMIGVRNPKDPSEQPICLEVWVNELRMTNFDKTKGWAANANVNVRLADLGNIQASGSYKTAGFGPLEQKLTTRAQEDVLRYDLAGNFNLDKFFPKKWGLQLPIYATIGEQRINPQFNPQEADVRTDKLIEQLSPEQAREKLEEIQDFRRTKSISFNNWRKTRTQKTGGREGKDGKTKQPIQWPWDISNFDFTYAYNEQFARNSVIQRRFNTTHRAAVNYRYNFPQVTIQPFKNVKKIKFLSDINFNPLPTSINVSITGDRQFEERQMRATSLFGGEVDPTFTKNFLINRNYNLVWNFTRNLQFTYSANNVSRVDEVQGYWDTATQRERDSVGTLWSNLLKFGKDPTNGHDNLINFGRTTTFTHNFNVAYQLPFQSFKLLDWITGTVNYTGSYNWLQAPEIQKSLGATIANSQNYQANGRLDLNGLYRKAKFLRKILEGQQQQGGRPGSRQPARPGPRNPDPKEEAAAQDSTQKPDPFRFLKLVGKEIVRIALSVRSVDLTYSQNNSTILPGYLPKTDNFGLDWGYTDTIMGNRSPIIPPTLGFVLGSQKDIRTIAGQNYWITQDTTLASLFQQTYSEVLTGRTSVELFKGFRIELSINRNETRNSSEFYRWNPAENDYTSTSPLSNGNFSMSYIFANTAFEKNQLESEVFNDFSKNRVTISDRLFKQQSFTDSLQYIGLVDGGFQNGYLGTNQDVLIPSLLAAYGPFKANKISLSSFPKIPLPNWSINYNGMTNLPFLKKWFNSVTFKHTYRGTYSVGNYQNNLNYADFNGDGIPDLPASLGIDSLGRSLNNFYALNNIQVIQIMEQFAPLAGINMTFKNGATAQIDYKRGRQMTFNIGNLQLTEMRSQDLAVMIGYRKDKLNWTLRWGGKDIRLDNSLNVQLRATIRDTRERNRTLGPTGTPNDPVQPAIYTRGTFNFILSPSIDYVVNTRLNLKLFFERNVNRPYASNAFTTSFTSGGVQIRFTLSN